MGLVVLAVLLFVSVFHPSGTCGRDPAMHSGASLWLYSVYHQPERLENGKMGAREILCTFYNFGGLPSSGVRTADI